jgi:hypothetical protein
LIGIGRARFAPALLALVGVSCGKFQQARECASFVKVVNSWLARPTPALAANAGSPSDAKRVAAQARATAAHYVELSGSLAELHIQGEELSPRVQSYRQITETAARTLREVADALDHGDLLQARQKRVEFDATAEREGPLVREINGVCR